jgi:DNA mismatch repair protein MutL
MPIKVLAPDVVSKIAAGEVVERPASVVKELVENSLDAGATRISIEVRDGGVNLLRVSDNGSGMAPDEIEIAFRRHATSKISTLADLESVSSLGFRGEALPSIAAVAHVELLTRTAQDTGGTHLRLQGDRVVEKGAKGCSQGTVVSVRNLFRNIPARLKFLKTPTTENGHIVNLITHIALAFPEVQFLLTIDGRESLNTPGNGRLRDVLAKLYGIDTAQAMLQVGQGEHQPPPTTSPSPTVVSGYVSPPTTTRTTRNYMSFYVNRRWVTSRLLSAALEKAYEGWLMTGKYPIGVLNISLPPREIDINVHPAKREVKFAQDQAIFSHVHKAVQAALEGQASVPEVSPRPTFTPHQEPRPNPFLFEEIQHPVSSAEASQALRMFEPTLPVLRVVGQFATSYIIAEGPDGLYLIDQHAAHERILFDKFMAQQTEESIDVQGLLDPLPVELSTRQRELFESKRETLTHFGFDVEPFGDRTVVLRGVPALLKAEAARQVIAEILDSTDENSPLAERERRVAMSVACHSAVKAGQVLDTKELQELMRELEQTTSPRTCPHGRPTMIHLSSGQLAREFGRH